MSCDGIAVPRGCFRRHWPCEVATAQTADGTGPLCATGLRAVRSEYQPQSRCSGFRRCDGLNGPWGQPYGVA